MSDLLSTSTQNQAQSPKSTPEKTPSVEPKPEAPPDLRLKQMGKVETESPLWVDTVTKMLKDIQDIKLSLQWGIASAVAAVRISIRPVFPAHALSRLVLE
jgi:hypothetical protein